MALDDAYPIKEKSALYLAKFLTVAQKNTQHNEKHYSNKTLSLLVLQFKMHFKQIA